jgi:tetratricopeptide (TPR) repeat protein
VAKRPAINDVRGQFVREARDVALEDPRQALAILERGLGKTRRVNEGAMLLKGNVLEALGQQRKAEAVYRSILRRNPRHAGALVDVADVLSGRRDAAAVRYYRRALALVESGRWRRGIEEVYVGAIKGLAYLQEARGRYLYALRLLAGGLQRYPARGELFAAFSIVRDKYLRHIGRRTRGGAKRR